MTRLESDLAMITLAAVAFGGYCIFRSPPRRAPARPKPKPPDVVVEPEPRPVEVVYDAEQGAWVPGQTAIWPAGVRGYSYGDFGIRLKQLGPENIGWSVSTWEDFARVSDDVQPVVLEVGEAASVEDALMRAETWIEAQQ